MKLKSILPVIFLMVLASSSEMISNNDLDHKGDKHDPNKAVVKGDLLFIKGNGVVCNKLKVGKNICVDRQLSFNNKGCNSLFAKGAQEKNLLNLRSTLCLACNPGLSCSLNNDCNTTSKPAVGCLDLTSSFCRNRVKVCTGEGIAAKKASVSVSGSSCLSQLTLPEIIDEPSISVTTNIQVELCIPLFFCIRFCDRPTLQVTSDDNSGNLTRFACIQDKLIGNDTNTEDFCTLNGRSVTTFLGAQIRVQNISDCKASIKYTLNYQNCIGINSTSSIGQTCVTSVEERACRAQKTAIEDICQHANGLLGSACFDINTEGRVL